MRMLWIGSVWMGVVAAAFPTAAQEGNPTTAPLQIASIVPPDVAAGAVRKQIEDPGGGVRWLLVKDPAHPGGPGRMVAVRQSVAGAEPRARAATRVKPLVRAGDAVQVEEHTAVVDLSLEAVALSSAAAGEQLRVRLRVGARVVTAIVLGPGRASLAMSGAAQ